MPARVAAHALSTLIKDMKPHRSLGLEKHKEKTTKAVKTNPTVREREKGIGN
jgi:hypothetical protein